ncbi:hypothetical protein [Hugenholtzia roseola]|nr:hypothetical protein [Hugenholtzia roseola]
MINEKFTRSRALSDAITPFLDPDADFERVQKTLQNPAILSQISNFITL